MMLRLLRYLARLTTGRIILWCYAIWYAVNVTNHFEARPRLWLTSIGLSGIIGFALLIRWGTNVAMEAKGRFERLTAAGLTMTIFFYVAINLMMVMGLAPVVGIPLPLISYGGSAMMTVLICLGVLMSIDRQTRLDTRRRPGVV